MRRIPQLDGIRALAVGLVVLDHCVSWFPGGGIGVCVFFVLSGYLITSLLVGEREQNGRVRLGMFYTRRALRLYPALLAMLLVTFLIGDVALRSVLIAATYTSDLFVAFGGDSVYPYGHTWSLAIEEQFYLLWPLFLPLILKASRRVAVGILTGLALASAIAGQVWVSHSVATTGGVDLGVFNPLWQAHGLLLGCALAFAIRNRTVPRAGLLTVVGLVACLATSVLASVTVGWNLATVWNLLSEFAALALIAGLRDRTIGVGQVFAWRPVVWVGARSYAIYLWHLPLIYFAYEWNLGRVGVFGAAALSILVAAISWRLVERPVLKLKHRFEPASPELTPDPARSPTPSAGRHAAPDGITV